MTFLVVEAFFVSRFVAKLVVRHKVGVYHLCYCVVNGGSAYAEFLLFHVFQQCINVETAVYRIDHVQYSESFRGASQAVLFQVVCQHLCDGRFGKIVFHVMNYCNTKLSLFCVLWCIN